MRSVAALAFSLVAVPLFAQPNISITTTPVTPAWGENFTITVRGTWPNGCVPKLQSVNVSGLTIQIQAAQTDCNQVCPQLVSGYSFQTPVVVVPDPGIYNIEYHLTDCKGADNIAATAVLPVARFCQFDRALSASAPTARVGSSILLHWCDPSISPGPDQGVNVSFFRVLMSRGPNGPFVPLTDINVTNLGLTFEPGDAGTLYFFVEAHMCTETIAGCSGDTVERSNIVSVNVVAANGCLPDATTLCLADSRFAVKAHWQTNDGNSGAGNAVPLTGDSGYFWFFGPNNIEITAKLLNACGTQSPAFWFFASGLTNVGVDLTVTDTKTNSTKTYHSPINQPFAAIQDTSAFSSCP